MLFVLAMLSGVFIVYMGFRQRGMQLEMQHRERMAMIEKGSIPLAEPPSLHGRRVIQRREAHSSRAMSFGILIVGLGLSLMTIIGIAGDSPEIGVGVGGAVAIIGGAFIARSVLVRGDSTTELVAPPPPPDDRAL